MIFVSFSIKTLMHYSSVVLDFNILKEKIHSLSFDCDKICPLGKKFAKAALNSQALISHCFFYCFNYEDVDQKL